MNCKCYSVLIIAVVSLNSCQQSQQDVNEMPTASEMPTVSEKAHSEVYKADSYADSLENLADKMHDESSEEVERSVSVSVAEGWSADKNLNTIRKITLKNTTNKKIIGVNLVYVFPVGKSVENRDMGKFKVNLKPLGTVALKVLARKFGVSDKIIDNVMFGPASDKVVASTVYFENGSVESTYIPIGFQHNE